MTIDINCDNIKSRCSGEAAMVSVRIDDMLFTLTRSIHRCTRIAGVVKMAVIVWFWEALITRLSKRRTYCMVSITGLSPVAFSP